MVIMHLPDVVKRHYRTLKDFLLPQNFPQTAPKMYPRSYPTHHRIIIKFHRSHVVNRVHNHAQNPVIISVYTFLSAVTAQAFQMLIWVSPESPNMKIPRKLAYRKNYVL
jgi:hypothetical protein